MSFLFLFLTTMICIHNAGLFQNLPLDIRHRIYNTLSATDKIESLITFCNETYQDFLDEYADEIGNIKQLESILTTQETYQIDTAELFDISHDLKLSELYAIKFPWILHLINHRHGNSENILSAMNIRTIPFSEAFGNTFHVDYNVSEIEILERLLVLSSRSLAPFSGKVYDGISNYGENGMGTPVDDRYPWLCLPDYCKSAHRLYFIYMYEYLFEHYHDVLEIPKLHKIYIDDDSKERRTLVWLIDYHGFIPWHEQALNAMKKRHRVMDSCSDLIKLHKITSKLIRAVGSLIFDNTKLQKLTALLLDILTHIVVKEFKNDTFVLSETLPFYSGLESCRILVELSDHNCKSENYNASHTLDTIKSRISFDAVKFFK